MVIKSLWRALPLAVQCLAWYNLESSFNHFSFAFFPPTSCSFPSFAIFTTPQIDFYSRRYKIMPKYPASVCGYVNLVLPSVFIRCSVAIHGCMNISWYRKQKEGERCAVKVPLPFKTGKGCSHNTVGLCWAKECRRVSRDIALIPHGNLI